MSSGIEFGPGTSEKDAQLYLDRVVDLLEDDEELLYVQQTGTTWHFLTRNRLIRMTGVFKRKFSQADLSGLKRLRLESDEKGMPIVVGFLDDGDAGVVAEGSRGFEEQMSALLSSMEKYLGLGRDEASQSRLALSTGTKEPEARQQLIQIAGFLNSDEHVVYAAEDLGTWFFVTDRRLLVRRGAMKKKIFEADLTGLERVAVDRDLGGSYRLIGFPRQGEPMSIAEGSARGAGTMNELAAAITERFSLTDTTPGDWINDLPVELGPGTKESEVSQALDYVAAHLNPGERVLYASEYYGTWFLLTQARLFTLSGGFKRSMQVADLSSVVRVVVDRGAKDSYRLVAYLSTGEAAVAAEENRASGEVMEDLSRAIRAHMDLNDSVNDVNSDQTLALGPSTKEADAQRAMTYIAGGLEPNEYVVFAMQAYKDWYFLTNQRLVVMSGAFKRSFEQIDIRSLALTRTLEVSNRWLVIGVVAHDGEVVRLAEFLKRESALALVRALYEFQPHLEEVILELGWPTGTNPGYLWFTTSRVAVVPDAASVLREQVTAVVVTRKRTVQRSSSGATEASGQSLIVDVRTADGRQFSQQQFLGSTQQAVNDEIVKIWPKLGILHAAGFPIVESEGVLEERWKAGPQQGFGVGFGVEF